MRSVTPRQMRRIDDVAINGYGIASVTLMENAGFSVAEVAKRLLGSEKNKRICVVCGKGNNGGDGLVASRHLLNSGFKVDVFMLAGLSTLGRDATFNLGILKYNGCIAEEIVNPDSLDKFIDGFDYRIVIDAIFGTGFSGGRISEPIRTLILFLNSTKCKTVSVDIPSGLNGASGRVEDVAVRADITVTLGLPKRGFFSNDGPFWTGKLIVKDIGFPESLLRS